MPKKLDFTLKQDEIAEIEKASNKDKRAPVRQRATAIRLLHLGHKAGQVAEMLSVSEPIIYNWFHRWQAGGLEGLANQSKKKPAHKATEAYCQLLKESVDQEPQELGYDFAIWTRERLRDHLERETGVRISLIWLGKLLKKLGYRFRRPKHELTNLQDQEAKESAKELLEE